jgi:hypothetical protein
MEVNKGIRHIYIYTTNDCIILLLIVLKVNRRHIWREFTLVPAIEFYDKLKIVTQESYTLSLCIYIYISKYACT